MKIELYELTVYPHGLAQSKFVFASRALAIASINTTYSSRTDWQMYTGDLEDLWVWDTEHPAGPDATPAVYGQPLVFDVLELATHL